MNRTRPKQIVIRMTEEEYQKVKKKVEKSGMSQQEYITRAITNKPIVNTGGLKELGLEIKRIGVNLNQIARSCNQGEKASLDEIRKIGKELNETWRLLRLSVQKQALEKQ